MNLLRPATLIGVPLAFSVLLWFHPMIGDYEGLRDVTTRFQVVHVGMVISLPLLAIAIYGMLDGLKGRAAAVGRFALIPFVVFYVPYVAFEGIALGVLGDRLNDLPADQRDAIAPGMVQDFASNPIFGEPGLFWALGSIALIVVMVSTVLAYRRAGAQPALQVMLGASVLIGAHAPPLASIGWACFAAAGWLVLRPPHWMREALRTMKRIGLLGGMSWESSAEYYRMINEETRDRLGGLHSADCLLRSVDFVEVERLQRAGDWDRAGALLAAEAAGLEAAGAELLVLCTNTMHKVADAITGAISIPFVHIADTTAEAVAGAGLRTVGLLATAYTMEQEFYVGRLRDVHGLDVLVPGEPDRRIVHDVIYHELCVGVIADDSRTEYRRIMAGLADRGAEGILLGCTEIDLLVGPEDAPVPVFDTTRLHARRAVELALEGGDAIRGWRTG